jgi:hypothetical protein
MATVMVLFTEKLPLIVMTRPGNTKAWLQVVAVTVKRLLRTTQGLAGPTTMGLDAPPCRYPYRMNPPNLMEQELKFIIKASTGTVTLRPTSVPVQAPEEVSLVNDTTEEAAVASVTVMGPNNPLEQPAKVHPPAAMAPVPSLLTEKVALELVHVNLCPVLG